MFILWYLTLISAWKINQQRFFAQSKSVLSTISPLFRRKFLLLDLDHHWQLFFNKLLLGGVVDCPTQLTLTFIFWYLYLSISYFITNIKVTNLKEIQQENPLWVAVVVEILSHWFNQIVPRVDAKSKFKRWERKFSLFFVSLFFSSVFVPFVVSSTLIRSVACLEKLAKLCLPRDAIIVDLCSN